MATNNTLKTQMQEASKQMRPEDASIDQLLNSVEIKNKFETILNKRAPQFIASILNLYKSSSDLSKCQPLSVITSAIIAATMDLPIDKNLGYAWIIPYKNKASFQIGYKGLIQLALRSGQYRAINVLDVHEGELISWNPLTEAFEMDFEKRKSDKVIGYVSYFELLNGFTKTVYWSKKDIEKHKEKFSKSDFGWGKDWDAMARKTVLRNMLSKWGILSIQMQNAVSLDVTSEAGGGQANHIMKDDGDIIEIVDINTQYMDIDANVDMETGELLED